MTVGYDCRVKFGQSVCTLQSVNQIPHLTNTPVDSDAKKPINMSGDNDAKPCSSAFNLALPVQQSPSVGDQKGVQFSISDSRVESDRRTSSTMQETQALDGGLGYSSDENYFSSVEDGASRDAVAPTRIVANADEATQCLNDDNDDNVDGIKFGSDVVGDDKKPPQLNVNESDANLLGRATDVAPIHRRDSGSDTDVDEDVEILPHRAVSSSSSSNAASGLSHNSSLFAKVTSNSTAGIAADNEDDEDDEDENQDEGEEEDSVDLFGEDEEEEDEQYGEHYEGGYHGQYEEREEEEEEGEEEEEEEEKKEKEEDEDNEDDDQDTPLQQDDPVKNTPRGTSPARKIREEADTNVEEMEMEIEIERVENAKREREQEEADRQEQERQDEIVKEKEKEKEKMRVENTKREMEQQEALSSAVSSSLKSNLCASQQDSELSKDDVVEPSIVVPNGRGKRKPAVAVYATPGTKSAPPVPPVVTSERSARAVRTSRSSVRSKGGATAGVPDDGSSNMRTSVTACSSIAEEVVLSDSQSSGCSKAIGMLYTAAAAIASPNAAHVLQLSENACEPSVEADTASGSSHTGADGAGGGGDVIMKAATGKRVIGRKVKRAESQIEDSASTCADDSQLPVVIDESESRAEKAVLVKSSKRSRVAKGIAERLPSVEEEPSRVNEMKTMTSAGAMSTAANDEAEKGEEETEDIDSGKKCVGTASSIKKVPNTKINQNTSKKATSRKISTDADKDQSQSNSLLDNTDVKSDETTAHKAELPDDDSVRILNTGLLYGDEEFEEMAKTFGATVASGPHTATHIVTTDTIKRTPKVCTVLHLHFHLPSLSTHSPWDHNEKCMICPMLYLFHNIL